MTGHHDPVVKQTGAVKRGGVKMNEITIAEKTEETVLQKVLNSIINLSFRFMCFSLSLLHI